MPSGNSLRQWSTGWPFSPQCFDNLVIWFDAQDTSSYNRGTNITSWRNKAYNGSTAVINGGGSYSSTTINGWPAINPTAGTGMSFQVAYTQNTVTCLVVSTTGNLAQNAVYLGSNTFGGLRLFCPSTSSQITMNSSSVGNILITTSLPAGYANSVCLLSAGGNGLAQSGGTIAINGTMFGGVTVSNTLLNPGSVTQYIMWDPSLGTSSTPAIGEIIVFDGALSNQQRVQVEAYLAWKWGLNSALPSYNPFFYSRPCNRDFAPVDISGCTLWLDGQDSTYIVNVGSNVLTWTDKSGTNAVGQGVNNPQLNTTTSGTAYGINFTGTQYFSLTTNPAPFNGSQGAVFVCGTGLNSSVTAGGYYYGTNGIGQGPVIVNASASPAGAVTWIGNGASPNQVFSPTLTGGFIASFIITASVATGFFNGTQVFSGGTTGGSATAINFIGTQAVTLPQNNLVGTIYEIIIYNSVATFTQYQRQQVEAYLAWKWNLRSKLPSLPGSPLNAPGLTLPSFVTRWVPTSFQNCVVWMDAADQSTYNRQSPANWRNKGTGAGTAITSGGAYASTINGVPAINTSLMVSGWALANMIFTQNARTIFIVSQTQSSSSNYGYQSWGVPSANNGWFFNYTNANKLYAVAGNGSVGNNIMYQATTVPSGFFNAASIISVGNNFGFFLNGAPVTSATTPNFYPQPGNQTQYIAWDNVNGLKCLADIGEFIIYDGTMPISLRQQVEGYLAWKWGLASQLPFYHPFKQIRP